MTQLTLFEIPEPPYKEAKRLLESEGINTHIGLRKQINADPEYLGLISPALSWYSGIRKLTYPKLDSLIREWRFIGLDKNNIDDYLAENRAEEIACRDIWADIFGYADRPSEKHREIITAWLRDFDISSIRKARYEAKDGRNDIAKETLLKKTDEVLRSGPKKPISKTARDNIQRIILDSTFAFLSDTKAWRYMRWPFRTGIGKTYLSKEVMRKSISDGHQIIYLSPQTDDLATLAEELAGHTKDPKDLLYGKDLDRDIVLIPSSVDAFLRAAGFKPYPGKGKISASGFLKDAIKELGVTEKTSRILFDLLKEIDDYSRKRVSDRVRQTVNDEFYQARRKLDEEIKTTLRSRKESRKNKPDKYRKIRGGYYVTEEEYDILIKYYPGVALDSAEIALMTFKKAESTLEPFGHYTLLGNTEYLENTILFIDEADSLMMSMLDTQIANRQNPSDLYKFFTSVVHGYLDLTEKKEEKADYGLDDIWFDKDGNVLKHLEKLGNVIEDTLREYPILTAGDKNFKPVFFKKETEDINPTLVQFPNRTKVFASGKDGNINLFLIKDDAPNGKRAITLDREKCKGEEKTDWAEFKEVTAAINRVITNFIAVVRVMAETIYANHNGDFSYEAATRSVLARFAFEENDRLFIQNSMYSRTPSKLQQDNVRLNDKDDPYAQGFACIGLTDSDEHFDQTYITADFMKMQPNAQLRHVIEGAYATILSSATAGLRSAINFDFDTINKLIAESHEESTDFRQAEYLISEDDFEELRKWGKELNIDVDVICVEHPETEGTSEEKLDQYIRKTLLCEFWNSASQIKGFSSCDTNKALLQLGRLNGAAMFMKELLSREYAHFGVVFQTANVNSGRDMYNEANIMAVADRIEKDFNPYNRKLTVILAKSKDKQKVREQLSSIETNEVVILITAENSFGTGVNLEQKINDIPRDPDGIFIGVTRNIIGSASEKPDGSVDLGSERLKRITLVESIRNMTKNCIDLDPMSNGEVDYYLDRSLALHALTRAAADPQGSSPMSPYKQAGAKVITQVSGRGDRQKKRNGALLLMYDSDIIDKGYLNRDMFAGTLISNALDALITDMESRSKEVVTDPEKVYTKAFRKGNLECLRRHRENLGVIERCKRNDLDIPEDAIKESVLTRDLAASLGYPEGMVFPESAEYMKKLFFTDLENHKKIKNPHNVFMQKRYGQYIDYETVKYRKESRKNSSMERIGCHLETIIGSYRKYDELTDGYLKKLRPGIFDKTEFRFPPYAITEDLAKGQLGEDSFEALFETRMQNILGRNGVGPLRIKPLEKLHEDFDFEIEGYPIFIDVKNRAAETRAVMRERLQEKITRMEPDNALIFYVNMEPRKGDRIPQSDTFCCEFGEKKATVVVIQGFFTDGASAEERIISADEKLNNMALHIKEFL